MKKTTLPSADGLSRPIPDVAAAHPGRVLSSIDAAADDHQRLISIFRAAPVGIGVVVAWVFREVNETLTRMTGYAAGELLGQSARMLYPSTEEFECVGNVKYRKIAREGVGSVETQWRRKDGAVIDILLSSAPFDVADLAKGVTFTALDITDLHQATEESRREKELIERIAALSPVGIVEVDSGGLIRFVNARIEEFLGATSESILGRPYLDIVSWMGDGLGRRIGRPEAIDLSALHQPLYGLERTFRFPDGRTLVMIMNIAPLRGRDGEYSGSVVTFEDITERRRIEAELQKTERLESLGVLAGGIAHDFRNLLEGIFGFIELARREEDRERVNASLDQALSVFGRARNLTEQMLTFAKGGAPRRKKVDVVELASAALRFVLHGSSLKATVRPGERVSGVFADPDQLTQVINNLVINARQAAGPDGEISLAFANRIVAESRDDTLAAGPYVEISVGDNGPGIGQANFDKIFDPFFTTNPGGTGLGLAICYSIVKRHGGRIDVISELGRGTVFTILLPAAGGDAPGVERTPSAHSIDPLTEARGTGRVLVMDDEPYIRQVTVMMLEKLGYQPETAIDGREAIEKFCAARAEGRPILFLILDQTIPGGLGGRQVLEMVRKIEPTIPAVIASGYGKDQALSWPAEDDSVAWLSKPVLFKDFAEVIVQIMNRTG